MPPFTRSLLLPLPQGWPRNVRSAVIQVIPLARTSLALTHGWASELNGQLRRQAEGDRLQQEIQLLREEIRIKDARMEQIEAHRRPHYPPTERLAILELRAARACSLAHATRSFLVTPVEDVEQGLTCRKISSYNFIMRTKLGTVLPLELSILKAGIQLRRLGRAEFHGFLIASFLKEGQGSRLLTAHGTLYKALRRLENAHFLESHWEDPRFAEEENRPRRRLYRVTAAGEIALARAGKPNSAKARKLVKGVAPA